MAAEPGTGAPEERASMAAWLGVAAGNIGAMMATLDISIANTALPKIQGEIGATPSEGTWISTAYLVAEIVMIPMAGWLERIFGLRNFLLGVATLFTLFSMMCGVSNDLGMMIIGRVGQGFTGGAMIPMAMAMVAIRLPPSEQPIGMAVFGVTVMLGPVLGPLIGGALTENISWRYVFFLNLPVGIGLITLLIMGVEGARARLEMLREADWLGVAGLIIGLGCLTVVLEEGQRERWFESPMIVWLSLASAAGFVLVAAGQMTAPRPVIELRLLRIPRFAAVMIMSTTLGAGFFGVLYLIPQFLAVVPGYNALQAGQITTINGVGMMVLVAMFPLMARTLDIRAAVAFGLFCFALSCFFDADVSPATAGPQFFWTQVLRGVAMFFSALFLNQAAANSVPRAMAEDASGLFNAARNLGGSFGLAAIGTLREQRGDFHYARLAESISANGLAAQGAARDIGVAALDAQLKVQATVMAFADLFQVFGVAFLVMTPLALLLKPLPRDVSVGLGG